MSSDERPRRRIATSRTASGISREEQAEIGACDQREPRYRRRPPTGPHGDPASQGPIQQAAGGGPAARLLRKQLADQVRAGAPQTQRERDHLAREFDRAADRLDKEA